SLFFPFPLFPLFQLFSLLPLSSSTLSLSLSLSPSTLTSLPLNTLFNSLTLILTSLSHSHSHPHSHAHAHAHSHITLTLTAILITALITSLPPYSPPNHLQHNKAPFLTDNTLHQGTQLHTQRPVFFSSPPPPPQKRLHFLVHTPHVDYTIHDGPRVIPSPRLGSYAAPSCSTSFLFLSTSRPYNHVGSRASPPSSSPKSQIHQSTRPQCLHQLQKGPLGL
ncbi:MAG: hypothetical protein J3R72DRAFT_527964, partial [Linnemannia gamsii]